jgi:flagellar biosynthesis/type III secretory pathway protein FliH
MTAPSTSAILRGAPPGPGELGLGAGAQRSRLLKAGEVAFRSAAADRRAAEAGEARLGAQLDEAYARGLVDGRSAADHESVDAALRGAAALEQLVATATSLAADEVDITEGTVLDAVLELAGWVLRAEPSQASRSLLARLSEAARTLAPAPRTLVQVSEADLAAVTAWARPGVEVVVSPRLAPGEARLDRGDGSAILTFSAALRRAAETLGVAEEDLVAAEEGAA